MKTAFSTLGCPKYTMDQIIAMAADNGYQGIELRAVENTVDLWTLPDFRGAGLKETARKLRDKGLAVCCVGTNIRFTKADKADRAANLETAKTYLEMAEALDCPYIRTFGGPLEPTQGYLESIEWIREGYEELCALAAKSGVTPLAETHDDFSTGARMLDILDGVSASNLGVVWDILHPYRYGEAVEATYRLLKDRIRHVHVKDSMVFDDKGFDFTLLGEGKMPVGDCLGLLKADGFRGYLSFEWEKMWHPEIPEPEVALPHYAKAIAQYL